MRDWIYKLMMAFVGIWLVGCNTIYEYGACPMMDEPHDVNFVLAIDNHNTTRASWDDATATDELGVGFENRIMASSLRVSIYTADNLYIGDVEELMYWPISEDGSRYQFHGTRCGCGARV